MKIFRENLDKAGVVSGNKRHQSQTTERSEASKLIKASQPLLLTEGLQNIHPLEVVRMIIKEKKKMQIHYKQMQDEQKKELS